jgi:hypothetical protein
LDSTHDLSKRQADVTEEDTDTDTDKNTDTGTDEDKGIEEDFGGDLGGHMGDNVVDDSDLAQEAQDDITEERRKRRSPTLDHDPLTGANAIKLGHDHQPIKRSASPRKLMTAENMGDVSRGRTKRDLGYDDLRELLSDPYADQGQRFEPLEDIEEEDPSYDYIQEDKRSEEDDDLLELKEEAIENEILRYEVVRKLLKEKEAEQTKEAVLDFLIEAAKDRVREAAVEEERIEEEQERERERASSVVKRYPYSYEPYGGRWGAMVPGAKRGGDYDRLYRLAQALNDNDDEDDEDDEKK